jgi:hypothetical protein
MLAAASQSQPGTEHHTMKGHMFGWLVRDCWGCPCCSPGAASQAAPLEATHSGRCHSGADISAACQVTVQPAIRTCVHRPVNQPTVLCQLPASVRWQSPQPAARSPQPAARSPQPAARSPCHPHPQHQPAAPHHDLTVTPSTSTSLQPLTMISRAQILRGSAPSGSCSALAAREPRLRRRALWLCSRARQLLHAGGPVPVLDCMAQSDLRWGQVSMGTAHAAGPAG